MPHVSGSLFWHFICNDKHCSKPGTTTSSRDRCTQRLAASMKSLNGMVRKPKGAHRVGGAVRTQVFSVTRTIPAV